MTWHLIARDLRVFFKDRGSLLLGFAVPIVLFSVFVLIFGGMARSSEDMEPIHLVVADEDGTDRSQRLVSLLDEMDALVVLRDHPEGDSKERVPYTWETARKAVADGRVATALVIPAGLTSGLSSHVFAGPDSIPPITLFHDTSQPLQSQVVQGLLQQALFMTMSDFWALQGVDVMAKDLGLDSQMSGKMSSWMRGTFDQLARLREAEGAAADSAGADSTAAGTAFQSPVPIERVDVLGETKKNPIAAMTASQVVVMFLLFSVVFSAAAILREKEEGTLRRLLVSPMTDWQFLLGKLGSTTIYGFFQILVMFVYGWLVFHMDLFRDFPAVLLMTAVSAASATALGLVIASLCKTHRQIDSIATLVVLTMSAVGGSMVPRFLMPAWMRKVGLVSFNAWAIDGYYKIFWREKGIVDILPQVGVLLAAGLVFFLVASSLFRKRFYA